MMTMANHPSIRSWEEISNNAWPALQTLQYDGWLLRFADGVTKRSNSVSLLYPSSLDPAQKIGFCEQLYHTRLIKPCFKITTLADPGEIDDLLASRGYFIHSHVSFQTKEINSRDEDLAVPGDVSVILSQDINPVWLDRFVAMNRFEPVRTPVYKAILDQVITPKCHASVVINGAIVAVGLGVLEDQYLGIFDLVVDPDHRRKGFALAVMEALLGWGAHHGATIAYLQVLTDNLAALSLYEQMGFTERYRYWYRMKA